MRTFRTQWNYNADDEPKETISEPSQTVPDQALSIPQILNYSRSGIDLGLESRDGVYDDDFGDDEEFDDFVVEDLTDVDNLRELDTQQ